MTGRIPQPAGDQLDLDAILAEAKDALIDRDDANDNIERLTSSVHDVPRLVAEVRHLSAELARVTAQRDAIHDQLADMTELASRLAAAVAFVADLDRPLESGGGVDERAALRTLAADARRAGLPAEGDCNCESYEPCHGACCGPGRCSCSLPTADEEAADG